MSDSRHLETTSGRPVGVFRSLQVVASSVARLAVVSAEKGSEFVEETLGAGTNGAKALNHLAEWGEVEANAAKNVGLLRSKGKEAAAMQELQSDFPDLFNVPSEDAETA